MLNQKGALLNHLKVKKHLYFHRFVTISYIQLVDFGSHSFWQEGVYGQSIS